MNSLQYNILLTLIRQEMERFGLPDFTVQLFFLPVQTPEMFMDLGNDVLFLVSESIGIQESSVLEFASADNYVVLVAGQYETFNFYKNQSFREFLEIRLNTGKNAFSPFNLEFIKVTPTLKH